MNSRRLLSGIGDLPSAQLATEVLVSPYARLDVPDDGRTRTTRPCLRPARSGVSSMLVGHGIVV